MVTWDVSSSDGQGEVVHHGQVLLVGSGALLSAKCSSPSGEREKLLDENQTQPHQDFGATSASSQQSRTTPFLLANPLHVNPTPTLGCYQNFSKKPALLPLDLGTQSCFLTPLPTHAPSNGPAQPLPSLAASDAPSTVLQL